MFNSIILVGFIIICLFSPAALAQEIPASANEYLDQIWAILLVIVERLEQATGIPQEHMISAGIGMVAGFLLSYVLRGTVLVLVVIGLLLVILFVFKDSFIGG